MRRSRLRCLLSREVLRDLTIVEGEGSAQSGRQGGIDPSASAVQLKLKLKLTEVEVVPNACRIDSSAPRPGRDDSAWIESEH